MLNLLSFIVVMQFPITLGNSNPDYTLCNQTFCDRIREVPSSSFTKYNSGMAGYHYHKKESKYDCQNIYSDYILDFSWIKNPTIKQDYPSEHNNHNMCTMRCDVKKKQIQRAVDRFTFGR
jgi:penicillin-binding protein-related factor A (putative recombinase)